MQTEIVKMGEPVVKEALTDTATVLVDSMVNCVRLKWVSHMQAHGYHHFNWDEINVHYIGPPRLLCNVAGTLLVIF